jgi:hypothetical protein
MFGQRCVPFFPNLTNPTGCEHMSDCIQARRHLLSISPKNTPALETIDSSILLVCLDDGPSPQKENERAWSYWAGGLTRGAEGNRWFDKHEVIVDEAGESGFNGEREFKAIPS